MFRLSSLIILAASLIASAAAQPLASNVLEDWVVDHASARVATSNAFERGPDGGMLGDRVLFDLRRRVGEGRATLVVSCLEDRFAIQVEGEHLLQEGQTADWPPAALVAKNYCGRLDELPHAETLTPI